MTHRHSRRHELCWSSPDYDAHHLRTIGLDVGGLGAGGVAYGGDTSHFSVVPWRLVLVSRTPHRQFLFEIKADRSSYIGSLLTQIPCPHYPHSCLHCGLVGKLHPYTQRSTGPWSIGGHVAFVPFCSWFNKDCVTLSCTSSQDSTWICNNRNITVVILAFLLQNSFLRPPPGKSH